MCYLNWVTQWISQWKLLRINDSFNNIIILKNKLFFTCFFKNNVCSFLNKIKKKRMNFHFWSSKFDYSKVYFLSGLKCGVSVQLGICLKCACAVSNNLWKVLFSKVLFWTKKNLKKVLKKGSQISKSKYVNQVC